MLGFKLAIPNSPIQRVLFKTFTNRTLHPRINFNFNRLNSTLPNNNKDNNKDEKKKLEIEKTNENNNDITFRKIQDFKITKNILKEQITRHIPGETEQTNTIEDRIPKFPFAKDAIPVLIPRPGVPRPGGNLMTMVKTLKSKSEPELIYEAESHKLYFVFCSAFALVAIIYGFVFLDWAGRSAWEIYKDNEQDLPPMHNLVMFISRNFVTFAIFAFPIGLAALMITLPTRLIRRIWYIPADSQNNLEELVKFTSHPFSPGRPTPVHTMPLKMLNRSYKTKIFTNEGFYLTADKGSFLFLLKEGNKKLPWIVDRKGFFWGDGRVFDHLFGKESVEEADLGISYDDKVGAVVEHVKREKERLRREEGIAWQFKEQGKLLKDDVKSIVNAVKGKSNSTKTIGAGDDKKKKGKVQKKKNHK